MLGRPRRESGALRLFAPFKNAPGRLARVRESRDCGIPVHSHGPALGAVPVHTPETACAGLHHLSGTSLRTYRCSPHVGSRASHGIKRSGLLIAAVVFHSCAVNSADEDIVELVKQEHRSTVAAIPRYAPTSWKLLHLPRLCSRSILAIAVSQLFRMPA